jgi:threonine/homoserine/homoserine lactone efflux protein
MQYFTLLFFGFLAAVLGVSLPGLLNMTAVKIAKEKGKKEVLYYVLGALVVIFIQTYIAIFFAKLIDSSSAIKEILHEVGLIIFGALTVYFFGFAKKKNKQKKEKEQKRGGAFVYGMFLAAVNVFSIPYYVFLSVTLSSYDYTIFKAPYTGIFSGGVVLGSALMFYIYVFLFRKKSVEETFVLRNINYIIGSITGIISLITVYKLIQ